MSLLSNNTVSANPFAMAPKNPTSPFATPAPNFETITGKQQYVPPYQAGQPLVKLGATTPAPAPLLSGNATPQVKSQKVTETTYHPPVTQTPTAPATTGYAQTDPSRIINNTTGQTAGGGFINPGNTGGMTPNGAQVDANGNIVSPSPNAPSPAATALAGVNNAAYGNTALGQAGNDIAKKYEGLINPILKSTIGQEVGDKSTGTTPVGEGNANLAAQAGGALIQGLTNQEQQELTASGQALTGQSQLQSGLNTALGAATDLTQAPYGTPLYNAATGQFVNSTTGAGLDMQSAMQTYAQGLANNTIPYSSIPSVITGNPVLNAQLLKMAGSAGSGGAGFNLNTSLGTQAGQQAIAADIPAWKAANNAAKGIQNQITNFLSSNPQLNPSDLAASNALQQWIQGQQLTDPKYQTLFNYLSEYTNTLAPILGVAGNPTNLKTEIAQGFINAKASGGSIADVLGGIEQLADKKIADYQTGGYGGTTTSGGGGSFVEGQTQSAGGYNFVYKNGQWVASQ